MSNETIKNNEPDIVPGMDVEHRWNSTYDLLVSALRITKSLTALQDMIVREKKNGSYDRIEEEDWEEVKRIKTFLEPFKQGRGLKMLNNSIVAFIKNYKYNYRNSRLIK